MDPATLVRIRFVRMLHHSTPTEQDVALADIKSGTERAYLAEIADAWMLPDLANRIKGNWTEKQKELRYFDQ